MEYLEGESVNNKHVLCETIYTEVLCEFGRKSLAGDNWFSGRRAGRKAGQHFLQIEIWVSKVTCVRKGFPSKGYNPASVDDIVNFLLQILMVNLALHQSHVTP